MLGEFIPNDGLQPVGLMMAMLQPVGLMARHGPQNLVANSPRNTKN